MFRSELVNVLVALGGPFSLVIGIIFAVRIVRRVLAMWMYFRWALGLPVSMVPRGQYIMRIGAYSLDLGPYSCWYCGCSLSDVLVTPVVCSSCSCKHWGLDVL